MRKNWAAGGVGGGGETDRERDREIKNRVALKLMPSHFCKSCQGETINSHVKFSRRVYDTELNLEARLIFIFIFYNLGRHE